MAKDDTEVLQTIIAKSVNEKAVATAKLEVKALQERKAALAAVIQPALDVPQIVAQPSSKKIGMQADENVTKNIKIIKQDISSVLDETRKSRTILDSILKSNLKYYESNSELLNRLAIANELSRDKLDALARMAAARGTQGIGAAGTGQQPPPGEGGGFSLGGLGSLLGLGSSLFRRKPPADVDGPDKKKTNGPKDKKKTSDPDADKRKDAAKKVKGGGRAAKLFGFLTTTLGVFGGLAALSYLSEDDPELRAEMLRGLVPDWAADMLSELDPDVALALGMQVPTIAASTSKLASEIKTFGENRAAKAEAPKSTVASPPERPVGTNKPPPRVIVTPGANRPVEILPDVPEKTPPKPAVATPPERPVGTNKTVAKPVGKPAAGKPAAGKPSPKVPSQAQEIFDRATGRASRKQIEEAAAEKVAKSGLKSALKKIPIISLFAGLGLGGYRYFWEGDTVGAGLEAGAGVAATIPLAGTALSIGADVASLVRDVYTSVYGIRPEEDENVGERFDELNTILMDYLQRNVGATPSQNSKAGYLLQSRESTNKLGDAISATTNAPDVGSSMNKSRAQYLIENRPPIAIPPRISQETINTIGNGSSTGQNNIVVKQGDTITNVTNNNTAGGGAGGVSGSPSKIPSPFDYLLYGDVFNWGN